MSILIPFLYILLGYIIGKLWESSSKVFSFLLINIFIPIVVIITIVSYKGSVFHIIALSYIFSLLMYKIASYLYSKNINKQIMQLCFSYYNIGWLGLPIAIYFFREEVTPIMIATYMGGMLYGTTVAIYSLNLLSKKNKISPLKKLFTSMPFIAFLIAITIKIIFGYINLKEQFYEIYSISKLIMSILGMSILGIWLEKTPIKKEHWKSVIVFSFNRLLIGIVVFVLLLSVLYYLNLITISEFKYLLIVPLLPVAANIVVLESYYLNSANSAHIIAINTLFSLILLIIFGLILKL